MPRGNWGTDEVHLHHRVGVLTRSNCADSRTQLYLTPASWETSQVSPPTQLLVSESGFKFKNPPGFKTPHIITDPTNSIYSDWRERGRKKYKTKNKQKTPKCFNSAWVVTILSIITREICIYFFVPFSLSFFFCEVKSKLLFALKKKKKSQPSERWQRHRCHQDTDKTMHKHWLQCYTGDFVYEKPLHLTRITELYFQVTRKAGQKRQLHTKA